MTAEGLCHFHLHIKGKLASEQSLEESSTHYLGKLLEIIQSVKAKKSPTDSPVPMGDQGNGTGEL